jgi:FixJ family two-component response regulator
MVMPRMSGPAFGRVLATTHPRMPILFMSAHTPDEAIRHDLSALGHPFLAKPFTREDLLRAVAQGLEDGVEREAAAVQA